MKMNFSIVPTLRLVTITLLAGLALVSCKKNDDEVIEETGDDIMVVAKADPELSTFVSAVNKAQLVTTLQQDTYTVLAPTNAAFAASGVDINTLSADSIRVILLSHVIVSEYRADSLRSGFRVTALNRPVYFSTVDASIFVNGNAKVVSGDIDAFNGIIHKVDHLVSLSQHNIIENIRYTPELSTLYNLLKNASLKGFTDSLSKGTYTLLAPSNQAFNAYKDTTNLRNILARHVIPNRVFTSGFGTGTVTTLWANHPIQSSRDAAGTITLFAGKDSLATKAKILPQGSNISATNGVVHRIDAVIR